jgi:aminoglycoside phosphotransferase (APT) family kinase protein
MLADAVGTAVRRQLGVLPVSVTRLSGFTGHENFGVRTSAGDFVLKAAAEGIATEAWVCQRVRRAGIPVPEIVAVDLDRAVLPVPYLLMTHVAGGPMPGGADAVAAVAGKWLRAVHDIPVEGYGYLGDAAPRGQQSSWAEFLTRPLPLLDPAVRRGILDAATAARLRSAVEENLPLLISGRRGSLLHGDIYPDHVFVHAGRVSAIIDWGDAAAGDPLFDLATWSTAASTRPLLRGYEPDADPELHRKILCYRIVWSLLVIVDDAAATTSWFGDHVRRTLEALDLLESMS